MLHCKSLNITFFTIYRNHEYTIDVFNHEFKNTLQSLKHPNLCIIGDININIFETNCYKTEYLDILSQFGFESYINKPTRSSISSSTCIDHIFVRSNSF